MINNVGFNAGKDNGDVVISRLHFFIKHLDLAQYLRRDARYDNKSDNFTNLSVFEGEIYDIVKTCSLLRLSLHKIIFAFLHSQR